VRRLRIAVPPAVAELAGGGGHGNMWRHVLAGLRERADVELRERAPRGPFARRPDVWLADGHATPPATGGAPLVVQVHEASWADPELAAFLYPDFARALEATTESAVRAARRVITPSEAARAQVAAAFGLDAGSVHAIHHGVELELFRPAADAPASPAYVLFVGVLHPRKNIAAVRQAAAELDLELVVVGGTPADRPDSRDLIASALAPAPGLRLRAVESPSNTDLAALYAGATAFCLPSFFEGFGLPALEAMAAGAPVVVSDRGALPEVVDGAGVVTTPDPASVTQGLREALARADELRPLARARAEKLPWSRTVDGWLAVLDSCAE